MIPTTSQDIYSDEVHARFRRAFLEYHKATVISSSDVFPYFLSDNPHRYELGKIRPNLSVLKMLVKDFANVAGTKSEEIRLTSNNKEGEALNSGAGRNCRLSLNLAVADCEFFLQQFANDCHKQGVPFCLKKFVHGENCDTIDIYSSSDLVSAHERIAKDILERNPDIAKRAGTPHPFQALCSGSMGSKIGYGLDVESVKMNSFTTVMEPYLRAIYVALNEAEKDGTIDNLKATFEKTKKALREAEEKNGPLLEKAQGKTAISKKMESFTIESTSGTKITVSKSLEHLFKK